MTDLNDLISAVRLDIKKRKLDRAEQLIKQALSDYPHSAIPHNLYGILLEESSKHGEAMKHFRAAWSLDPNYLPARYNLDNYASFGSNKLPVYCEADMEDIK